jgi:RimJ/RimL family protein N-acetyltransferase
MDDSFVAKFKSSKGNLVVETDEGECIGALETMVAEHALDLTLLERICDWHNRALEFYIDPKPWRPHSTAHWLINTVISSERRILFLVQNESGVRIGLCGLSNIFPQQADVYDIVRGDSGGHPLLFPYAQIAMLRLGFHGIGLQSIVGAVHRQNVSARRVGRFVGFEEYEARESCSITSADQSLILDTGSRISLRITSQRLAEKHPALSGFPRLRSIEMPVGGM